MTVIHLTAIRLAVCALIAVACCAQERGHGGDGDRRGSGQERAAKLEPRTDVRPLALGHCRTVVSTRPRRISPGAAGEIVVVLVLRAGGVIERESRLAVDYESTQGPIRLGAWHRDEPELARHAPAYTGQHVFDDTLTLYIPIVIEGDAVHGVVPTTLTVRAAVHDGRSGDPIGRYEERVRCDVRIGSALPSRQHERAGSRARQPESRVAPATASVRSTPDLVPTAVDPHGGGDLSAANPLRVGAADAGAAPQVELDAGAGMVVLACSAALGLAWLGLVVLRHRR